MTQSPALLDVVEPHLSNARWRDLTALPEKPGLYSRDAHFRVGHAAASGITPDWISLLHQIALVIIKNDGIRSGITGRTVALARESGFIVAAVELLAMGPRWRELWRHQLHNASLDRLFVNEAILSGPCTILLLVQTRQHAVPASVRFSQLKGAADPNRQAPSSFRKLLGARNRFISLLHAADEPADILRELGIFFSLDDVESLLRACGRTLLTSEPPQVAIRKLEKIARVPLENIDPQIALQNLRVLSDDGNRSALAELVNRVERQDIGWLDLVEALNASGLELQNWDVGLLGTVAVDYDDQSMDQLLGSPTPAMWTHST